MSNSTASNAIAANTSLTDSFARARLGHLPTPLEPLARIAANIDCQAPLLVKRDDCTGLAFGGNKVRQLEFYLGDALAKRATLILITGAVQSNYVRTVAAAAAKMGLKCIVQLEERVPNEDETYRTSGNVLLDHLLGAEVVHYPHGEDEAGADAALEALADAARERGETPYVVHLSEQPRPLGTLGYVVAAEELIAQADASGVVIETVVLPSGSAATHAGMLVGLHAIGRGDVRVLGACVRRDAKQQRARVLRVARTVGQLLEKPGMVSAADVWVDDSTLGPGYGQMDQTTQAALQLAARCEGLILDPVYSAKAFAALLAHCAGLRSESATVFMHTGGTPALFAYAAAIAR